MFYTCTLQKESLLFIHGICRYIFLYKIFSIICKPYQNQSSHFLYNFPSHFQLSLCRASFPLLVLLLPAINDGFLPLSLSSYHLVDTITYSCLSLSLSVLLGIISNGFSLLRHVILLYIFIYFCRSFNGYYLHYRWFVQLLMTIICLGTFQFSSTFVSFDSSS